MNKSLRAVSSGSMGHGLVADYEFPCKLEQDYVCCPPSRNLATRKKLKESLSSRLINRLDHSLQTSKHAQRDGVNIELIVAALIHNVDSALAQGNHSQLSVTIFRPFFRD